MKTSIYLKRLKGMLPKVTLGYLWLPLFAGVLHGAEMIPVDTIVKTYTSADFANNRATFGFNTGGPATSTLYICCEGQGPMSYKAIIVPGPNGKSRNEYCPVLDKNGKQVVGPVYELDENGIPKKDENGNPIKILGPDGKPIMRPLYNTAIDAPYFGLAKLTGGSPGVIKVSTPPDLEKELPEACRKRESSGGESCMGSYVATANDQTAFRVDWVNAVDKKIQTLTQKPGCPTVEDYSQAFQEGGTALSILAMESIRNQTPVDIVQAARIWESVEVISKRYFKCHPELSNGQNYSLISLSWVSEIPKGGNQINIPEPVLKVIFTNVPFIFEVGLDKDGNPIRVMENRTLVFSVPARDFIGNGNASRNQTYWEGGTHGWVSSSTWSVAPPTTWLLKVAQIWVDRILMPIKKKLDAVVVLRPSEFLKTSFNVNVSKEDNDFLTNGSSISFDKTRVQSRMVQPPSIPSPSRGPQKDLGGIKYTDAKKMAIFIADSSQVSSELYSYLVSDMQGYSVPVWRTSKRVLDQCSDPTWTGAGGVVLSFVEDVSIVVPEAAVATIAAGTLYESGRQVVVVSTGGNVSTGESVGLGVSSAFTAFNWYTAAPGTPLTFKKPPTITPFKP